MQTSPPRSGASTLVRTHCWFHSTPLLSRPSLQFGGSSRSCSSLVRLFRVVEARCDGSNDESRLLQCDAHHHCSHVSFSVPLPRYRILDHHTSSCPVLGLCCVLCVRPTADSLPLPDTHSFAEMYGNPQTSRYGDVDWHPDGVLLPQEIRTRFAGKVRTILVSLSSFARLQFPSSESKDKMPHRSLNISSHLFLCMLTCQPQGHGHHGLRGRHRANASRWHG